MSAAVGTSAPECIVTIDDRVVEFDPAAEALFGWSREEAVGHELSELFVLPEYAATHRDGIVDSPAAGTVPVLHQRVELPAVRRDGTHLIIERRASDAG